MNDFSLFMRGLKELIGSFSRETDMFDNGFSTRREQPCLHYERKYENFANNSKNSCNCNCHYNSNQNQSKKSYKNKKYNKQTFTKVDGQNNNNKNLNTTTPTNTVEISKKSKFQKNKKGNNNISNVQKNKNQQEPKKKTSDKGDDLPEGRPRWGRGPVNQKSNSKFNKLKNINEEQTMKILTNNNKVTKFTVADKKEKSFTQKQLKYCDNWFEQKGRNYILKCNQDFKKPEVQPYPLNYVFKDFKYENMTDNEFKQVKPKIHHIIQLFNLAISHHRSRYGSLTNILTKVQPSLISEETKTKINTFAEKTIDEELDSKVQNEITKIMNDYSNDPLQLLIAIKLAINDFRKKKRMEIWKFHPYIKIFVDNAFSACNVPERTDIKDTVKTKVWNEIFVKCNSNSPPNPKNYLEIYHDELPKKIKISPESNFEPIPLEQLIEGAIQKMEPEIKEKYLNNSVHEVSIIQKPVNRKMAKADDKIDIELDLESLDDFPPLKCNICHISLERGDSFISHLKKCVKKHFLEDYIKCPECDLYFDKDALKIFVDHLAEKHQDFQSAPNTSLRF